jgi:hypothetical protein
VFSQEFDQFLEQQKSQARGQRLEMLNKNLSGTKRMLEVIWPALKSFYGITLEHEIVSSMGVRIYIDAFYEPLGFALESEGFAVHAEKITRDRFDFEKVRVRTMDAYNYMYVPYSRDELDKNPEFCLRNFYELLGRFSISPGTKMMELSVYEREVLRYAVRLGRPLRLDDVKYCTQSSYASSRSTIQSLVNRGVIRPIGTGTQRFRKYELLPMAKEYLLG